MSPPGDKPRSVKDSVRRQQAKKVQKAAKRSVPQAHSAPESEKTGLFLDPDKPLKQFQELLDSRLESATEYVRHPNLEGFNQTAYAQTLGNAKAQGLKIWNMAYVQNQGYATHSPTKHQRYLVLLEHLMSTGVTAN
jgi:5-hmdU DNA kinase-like protein